MATGPPPKYVDLFYIFKDFRGRILRAQTVSEIMFFRDEQLNHYAQFWKRALTEVLFNKNHHQLVRWYSD